MAARITQQVVDMQSQLKHKDEELLKHKEEGFSLLINTRSRDKMLLLWWF